MKIKIFVGLLLIIAIMPLVLGAVTLTAPTLWGNETTTMTVTCESSLNTTETDGTVGVSDYNVSIYYNVSGGAAGETGAEGTILTTITNSSAYQGIFTSSVSITGLADALSIYNFSCKADNITDTGWSDGIVNITIDNTFPVVTLSTDISRTNVGRTIMYSTYIADAISLVSSSCTATDPDAGSHTLSIGVTNKDFNLDRSISDGTWTFNCTGTDRPGNTAGKQITLTTNEAGEIDGVILPSEQQPFNFGNLDTKTIAIVAGIILILWLVFKKR